jgi:hypothetical protein
MAYQPGIETTTGNMYCVKSDRCRHTVLPPALTIGITDKEARIHTTLGEIVVISKAEFIALVRRILRENGWAAE